MWHFFNQAEYAAANESPAGPEIEFRGQNITGLIEKRTDKGGHFVLLFATGTPVGVYDLGADSARAISISEFSSTGSSDRQKLHPVKLTDTAGRMVWLALESKSKGKLLLSGADDWQNKVTKWNESRWSGLVEVKAGVYQGFVFFWQGEVLATDAVLCTPEGFVSGLSSFSQLQAAKGELTFYEPEQSSPAFQYFILRQGAVRWSHKILSSYQDLVGKSLVRVMNREINRSIQPWNWNLILEGNGLNDAHFFPQLQLATYAYRALFMDMGTQMSFMIGNHLAQRIFSDAFKLIFPEETAVLQAHRLIPAAFTN